ncbi:hypothetical protein LR48_Vigan404s003100 [Vigna angularis]|uniref:Uncharacterized protein n=1 Tax=Phaseolus angularis TaxID=3914 RepID=A0A0L9T992_PHAAN|nr:hypothetical protein LR48_Vigan404s003100 [Vigna angularis]
MVPCGVAATLVLTTAKHNNVALGTLVERNWVYVEEERRHAFVEQETRVDRCLEKKKLAIWKKDELVRVVLRDGGVIGSSQLVRLVRKNPLYLSYSHVAPSFSQIQIV